MIDASPAGGSLISFSEFLASPEATSVSRGFNDANTILSNYESAVTSSTGARQKFLDNKFDRDSAYLAAEQANVQAQLTFANDKEARHLAESNRKNLNAMSNLLSAQGGYGSAGGNLEVLEARQKGDQAIVDLNKEYGFKHTDVSLKFTQMYNEASDTYKSSWLEALDNFDAKIADIATQKNANETSKRAAIKEAYEGRNKAVTDANLAHAKAINDATNNVVEYHSQLRADDMKKKDGLWDRLFKQRAADGNLNPTLTNKILKDMKDAGIDTTGIDPNTMTLEQQNEMYRRAKEIEAASGRVPLGQQVQQLTDADKAFSLLDRAEDAISKYQGVGGTIGGMTGLGDLDPGWAASAAKFGADILTGVGIGDETFERQREAAATFLLVKQVIGKAMEGGVLRKEDELKYEKMIPNLRDSDRMRTYKLEQLRQEMNAGKQALLNNMQQSGYNTSGYNVDGRGNPLDPIGSGSTGTLTNEEVDEIMNKIESGEPLSGDINTGFLNTLALAHVEHEGYGTKNAVSITANNNPGALRWTGGQKNYGGVKPGAKKPDGTTNDTGFTWFPDVASGYKALIADLRAKISGGSAHINYASNPTMLDYISVYAPAGDNNNPSAYTRALVAKLNAAGYEVNANTPLSELSRLIS
jgi:hypothetical protein